MKRTIARMLLQIGAVTLRPDEPFIWTSGIRSPIYCDNRLTLSYPSVRDTIAEGFRSLIVEKWAHVDVIAGTATGAIAHAAWIAQKMSLPMVYIRSSAKGHGKQNLIEGVLRPGQRVVVIEDLISTGGSCLQAAKAVEDQGGTVAGIASIFTYNLSAGKVAFEQAGHSYEALSDFATLIDVAREVGVIDGRQLGLLKGWVANPTGFSLS